ncbi:hypothetical protein BHE90_013270 [Fusarium euwallaceae]|uniref:Uncharacterized protein n=1 Tax=Fusarium euwallaceae TaxID=1147111 RepID=A0A430L9A6_9HYPO|nr:hypothetical protein BHE90_013270 [Fusarium euwallaceae]
MTSKGTGMSSITGWWWDRTNKTEYGFALVELDGAEFQSSGRVDDPPADWPFHLQSNQL